MKHFHTFHRFFYLVSLLSLSLTCGYGDTEDREGSVVPLLSVEDVTTGEPDWYTLGIPRDWYTTEDSELYVRYHRAMLIRKFGDIPELHTYADIELKVKLYIPITHDEYIVYLKIIHRFWPNQQTLQLLEKERERRAQGQPFYFFLYRCP